MSKVFKIIFKVVSEILTFLRKFLLGIFKG